MKRKQSKIKQTGPILRPVFSFQGWFFSLGEYLPLRGTGHRPRQRVAWRELAFSKGKGRLLFGFLGTAFHKTVPSFLSTTPYHFLPKNAKKCNGLVMVEHFVLEEP